MTSQQLPARNSRRTELLFLAGACLACLLPFAGKAINIDDPLFVWAAQHIGQHPVDFFGFNVHWYISWEPMVNVTQNPPGACYYLALVGSLFGWSEVTLHVAMILPALGVLYGTYRLGERFNLRPLPAALVTLSTPAFLLCSTTLMCDTLMLCFWVWAIVFWDEGLRNDSPQRLHVAALLIIFAATTKYFGVCLLPLLVAYALAIDIRRWRRCLSPVGLSIAGIIAYQQLTKILYGYGHVGGAMEFAKAFRSIESNGHMAFRLCSGLAFAGGCAGISALAVLAMIPGRTRAAAVFAAIGVVLFALLLPTTTRTDLGIVADSPFATGMGRLEGNWPALMQFAIWVVAGVAILFLAVTDLAYRRDAISWLLFLWIGGTYLFAAYINWALNGRSVVPLVPAVGLLIARRLDYRLSNGGREPRWLWPALLTPAFALSMIVTRADAELGASARVAANYLADKYGGQDRQLWYTGHWGFQYYLNEQGALPWDYREPGGKAGDIIVVPENNAKYPVSLPQNLRDVAVLEVKASPWLTTLQKSVGAGYYSDYWGPLPFVFGNVPAERYVIKELVPPATARSTGQ